MSPAPPAIRPRCWRGWRAASWRWRRTRRWRAHARENLAAVGAANAEVVSGALPDGWQAGAPYDVILVNGAAEVVPERLLRQLREGGRLVGVVGRAPASKAMRYLAAGGQASALPVFDAAAPPLPGFAAAAGIRILITPGTGH